MIIREPVILTASSFPRNIQLYQNIELIYFQEHETVMPSFVSSPTSNHRRGLDRCVHSFHRCTTESPFFFWKITRETIPHGSWLIPSREDESIRRVIWRWAYPVCWRIQATEHQPVLARRANWTIPLWRREVSQYPNCRLRKQESEIWNIERTTKNPSVTVVFGK